MTEEFIPCIEKSLPLDLQEAAAAAAVAQNPANRPAVESLALVGMVLPPAHLAVLTTKYWGKGGVKLTVGFLEQISDELADKIVRYLNLWNEYCNFSFVRTKTDPMVRITREGDGYWSYIGTDILQIPRDQPTMCLQRFSLTTPDSEFLRVVPHEGGHSGGFPHEHSRQAIVELLDVAKTIAYFQRTQGWTAAMVRAQILTPLSESSIMGSTETDPTSLMSYSFPGSITKNGKPIPGGSTFSLVDKQFSAKIYPKVSIPDPPEPPNPGGFMNEVLTIIVRAIASAARDYVKGTPSKLDDLLIPVIDAVEKWVIENVISKAANDPRLKGLNLPQGTP